MTYIDIPENNFDFRLLPGETVSRRAAPNQQKQTPWVYAAIIAFVVVFVTVVRFLCGTARFRRSLGLTRQQIRRERDREIENPYPNSPLSALSEDLPSPGSPRPSSNHSRRPLIDNLITVNHLSTHLLQNRPPALTNRYDNLPDHFNDLRRAADPHRDRDGPRTQSPSRPHGYRGHRGVTGTDTDAGGRRTGPLDPDELGEGIEREILPAYDMSMKGGPPRYVDIMFPPDVGSPSSLGRTRLSSDGVEIHEMQDLSGLPPVWNFEFRHPADVPLRDAHAEGTEPAVVVSDTAVVQSEATTRQADGENASNPIHPPHTGDANAEETENTHQRTGG